MGIAQPSVSKVGGMQQNGPGGETPGAHPGSDHGTGADRVPDEEVAPATASEELLQKLFRLPSAEARQNRYVESKPNGNRPRTAELTAAERRLLSEIRRIEMLRRRKKRSRSLWREDPNRLRFAKDW